MRSSPLAVIVSLLAIAPTALAAWGLPDPVNSRLETISDIYLQILLVGTLVFVFVFGWMAYNLLKFRPGGEGEATDEEHRGSAAAEIAWTVVPLIIVTWVAAISYGGMQDLNAQPEDPAAEIQVDGFRWFWQADYGDGVVIKQETNDQGEFTTEETFKIPANEPVVVNVTGRDVIHAFKIAELGVMVDATPGENNYASFTAPEGEYLVQCAEMCGNPGHAYMNARIEAVPADEYEDWLEEKRAEAQSAGLQHTVEITLTDDGFDRDTYPGVGDVETLFTVTNDGGAERSFELEDADVSTNVPAGETVEVNATLEAGSYTLTSEDDQANLEVVEPEQLTVQLDEWAIRSDTTTFEAGTPYLVTVENAGSTLHNLYLGTSDRTADEANVFWQSADIQPGDSDTMLVVPAEDQAGEYEWWCDIGQHYEQGMQDSVTVE